jgi:hypothetical protein
MLQETFKKIASFMESDKQKNDRLIAHLKTISENSFVIVHTALTNVQKRSGHNSSIKLSELEKEVARLIRLNKKRNK